LRLKAVHHRVDPVKDHAPGGGLPCRVEAIELNQQTPISHARLSPLCPAALALAVGLLCATAQAAINPADVLVLYNVDSPDGIQIANYYAQVHPGVQLLGLNGVSTAEEIDQNQYLNTIRPQVLAALNASTQVIVTTKGLPLRINNSTTNPGTYPGYRGESLNLSIPNGWWQTYSSLESELTRIDSISTQEQMGDQSYLLSPPAFPFATDHHAANPYYNRRTAFDRADPLNEGMRLSARLDGFTAADVIASIDRAQQAYIVPTQQLIIVDDDPNAPAAAVDRMPQLANNVLTPMNQAMVFDQTTANILDAAKPILGYVSHGSHAAGTGFVSQMQFDIAPGAVFHTWESFNANSFVQGNNRAGQSLIAEWIAKGGTAALGHVEEPTASAASVANEDILFDMLLNGYSLVEAAWAATLQLSFVNTVVGDPLMTLRPWVPGDSDLDGAVDIDDLNILLTNWQQSVGSAGMTSGDPDFDGFVDQDDLNTILAADPGQGTVLDVLYALNNPPAALSLVGLASSQTDATVPTPASLTLMCLGGLALLRRRAG
jgi:uncharacterized protein (TIGR03790 family)